MNITEHPEFKASQEKYINSKELGNYKNFTQEWIYISANQAYKAGGETAQAILQPEIENLKIENEVLIETIEHLVKWAERNGVDTGCIEWGQAKASINAKLTTTQQLTI